MPPPSTSGTPPPTRPSRRGPTQHGLLRRGADSLAQGTDRTGTAARTRARDLADAELALIEGAGGTEKSPILGYTEDYSQYKPRGHYTRSEELKRYFKAMMWYGHTGFFINPRDPDVPEELAASLTRRAILIPSSLAGPAKEAWTAVYEPTSFLVGRADDLTVDDMQTVIKQVFGTAQPAPDALADAGKIATVREELNKLPAPKILTSAVRASRRHPEPGGERAELPGHGPALHPRFLRLPATGVGVRGRRAAA